MTAAELLIALREALAGDAELESWCMERFGRAPTIALGVDEENPPQKDEYPLVAIIDLSQSRGNLQPKNTWEVHLGVGVVNNTVEITGNRKTYPGMLQAEEMRVLAENAIYRSRLAPTSTVSDTYSISSYPLFVSHTYVTFTGLRSSEGGMP